MLLNILKPGDTRHTPIWLMRQAGRYLPEYRALRAEKGGFLDLVYDPIAAAEITMQPIKRFDLDAAILFSDILVVPHAMGQKLWFEEGEGPRLAPGLIGYDWEKLSPSPDRLEPVYETVRRVKAHLPLNKAMLGFIGSPWTVATYMLKGSGSKDQSEARRYACSNRNEVENLLDSIIHMSIQYLKGQIDAGVDAIQLFESWAGTVASAQFENLIIGPNAKIVQSVKNYAPHIPIIGFPRGVGGKLRAYVEGTGVDAVGLDEMTDPVWADAILPNGFPVQGNLDPLLLEAGGAAMSENVAFILRAFRNRPHIFNLGHGILQTTPIAHVEEVISQVRKA